MAEGRMNLAALQQRDPYITDIVDTASQVALYSFNSKANEWEKTSIEGSLFIYKRNTMRVTKRLDPDETPSYPVSHLDPNCLQRSASPLNGFMILNRLGLNNLVEPITKDLEFQQQDPFLLYRNAKSIYGVWFYDKDECGRLGGLLNRFVADIFTEQKSKLGPSPSAAIGSERDTQRDSGNMAVHGKQQSQVDIMQMLSKAQQEYNTGSTAGGGVRKKTEPKPMIDNPNASATSKAGNIIRPKPLKMPDNDDRTEEKEEITTPLTAGTISLDALFRTASLQQGGGAPTFPTPGGNPPTILKRSTSMTGGTDKLGDFSDVRPDSDELPSILKHIMSTGSMVEDIERHHIAPDDPIPIMPDFTQPPPNHPAYRGPSPQTQPPQARKSPRDTKPIAAEKVVFGLSEDGGYGSKPTPSLGSKPTPILGSKPAPSVASSSVLSGSVFPPPTVSAISSQHVSVSQSSSVHISSTETVFKGKGSPRGQGDYVTKEKQQASPPISKSEALLTPADLLQPSTAIFSSHSEKPMNPNLATAAASLSTELLSPMAFLTSTARKTPPVLPERQPRAEDKVKDTEARPIAALTKEQLQQALLYLVTNDSNFISTIHEAYLKSLKELAGKKS